MKFKGVLILSAVSIATLAMLLPVIHFVNLYGNDPALHIPALRAFCAPFPPLPPRTSHAALVADGAPFPPLPPSSNSSNLMADGAPFPPLPPKSDSWLLADGAPFPPLPPKVAVEL